MRCIAFASVAFLRTALGRQQVRRATSKMSQETALPSDGVQRAGSNITGRFDLPKGFRLGSSF